MNNKFYLEFENRFRGDQEKVFQLFSNYDPLIKLILKNNHPNNLLDIGCGRGEWLRRWKDQVNSCIGIESEESMVKICRGYGLNILEGDAIDKLKELNDSSITIITIFHVIEHIEYNKLLKLIDECQRVLTDKGVLIMETPSIDNLIVSTKNFHLDHTHINPINPDGISFAIEQLGFHKVKHFYLHAGPLKDDSPLKITRILNGVAQDICIVAAKKDVISDIIFKENIGWESSLDCAMTTFDAAIEHDLKLESILNEYNCNQSKNERILNEYINRINSLEQEMIVFKSEFKYYHYCAKIIKFIFRPLYYIFKLIRKTFLIICNKIFILFAINSITRKILTSNLTIVIINFFLRNLVSRSVSINKIQIRNKINKIISKDLKLLKFNNMLLLHYKQSKEAKRYQKLIK